MDEVQTECYSDAALLTRLCPVDPSNPNQDLSDGDKKTAHSDASLCIRMMVALDIDVPLVKATRLYSAGLVSMSGRYVYPIDDGYSRPNAKAGQPHHANAAFAVDVAAPRPETSQAILDAYSHLAQKLARLPPAERVALRERCIPAANLFWQNALLIWDERERGQM